MARYLSSLQNFTPGGFAHFTPEGKTAAYRLTLEGNDMAAVTIKGFREEEGLLLHSSLNDNAWFKTGNSNAFNDLFSPPDSFLADRTGR